MDLGSSQQQYKQRKNTQMLKKIDSRDYLMAYKTGFL